MPIPTYARLVLAGLAFPLGLAWAANPADARTTHPAPSSTVTAQEDFRWSGRLAAGQRLEIKGVNGGIRAEPASGNEVEVVAVKRAGREGRVQDVRIERITHGDGVTICAIYPSANGRRPNRCTAGEDWSTNVQDNDVSVEFTVRVPRGVDFLGATVNGNVRAQNLPGDAHVSSVNGSVTASAAGVVEASTVNGTLNVQTGAADPGRDLEFTTVNGNINLTVPAGFRADVRASLLNGNIESDWPLDIERGRYVGQNGRGQIGRGGHELKLETVNGNIEIRRAR
ncbi:MAG TPA: DUF4097 family beta strand repeat-containing protein [Longimicrobium sp.]|jgi:hypothetical protein|nr:DUF4097 family beta strand repeat-containing protein [Longimicrobium sp.]